MAWETLAAASKTSGKSLASALLRKNKHGEISLVLSLSTFITDALGAPDKVVVQIGRGEHAGQLRIEYATDGPHKVVTSGRSRRITLPWFEGLPQAAAETQPVTIISQAPEPSPDLVVRMPVVEWENAISRRAAAAPSRAAPPPVALPKPYTSKVDLVEFLKGKKKAARLAGGQWFMLEGERVPLLEVLELANSFRTRAKLPAFTLDDVY